MNPKNAFSYITLIVFATIIFYYSWLSGALEFVLMVIIYTLLFFVLYYFWKRLRKKDLMSPREFVDYFLLRISFFLILITSLLWWFSYYFNEIDPAPMPEYTLSDWVKTVKFQWMSHIWTRAFYDTVIQNLKNYKIEWWVYFYEWVKPWSQESAEKFNNAMWIKFDNDLYKNFSKLYWVVNQDNREYFGYINDLDFNVDLNMDEIVALYDERTKDKEKEYKEPLDVNKDLVNTLSGLSDKQLQVLVYLNRAILNFIIWSESTQSFLTDNFANTDLFEVILGKRNEVLSDAIIKSEYNKIYITYWLLHFKWVLELLKQNNPNWKIVSVKNLYPIKD